MTQADLSDQITRRPIGSPDELDPPPLAHDPSFAHEPALASAPPPVPIRLWELLAVGIGGYAVAFLAGAAIVLALVLAGAMSAEQLASLGEDFPPWATHAGFLLSGAGVIGIGYALMRRHGSVPFVSGAFAWPGRHWISYALALWVAFYAVIIAIELVFNLDPAFETARRSAQMFGIGQISPFAIILTVAVIVPIAEEILFRGFLFGWLRTATGVPAAIVLSAAAFAVAHVTTLSPDLPELVSLGQVFVLGVLAAMLYERSGSLLPSMALHMTNNYLVVTSLMLTPLG